MPVVWDDLGFVDESSFRFIYFFIYTWVLFPDHRQFYFLSNKNFKNFDISVVPL